MPNLITEASRASVERIVKLQTIAKGVAMSIQRLVRLLGAATLVITATSATAGSVSIRQGDVARWSGMEASKCGYLGRLYPAVDGVCYYPTDMKARTGRYDAAIYDAAGNQHIGHIDVTRRECGKFDVKIENEALVNPQGADLDRHLREYRQVKRAINPKRTEPRFTLPLGQPASSGIGGDNDFCFERRFNELPYTSTHTGRDYPVATGTTLSAVADGKVVLAADHFMTGNAIYIDHGDGLVSEYFHLSEMDVKEGDEVKKGQAIGKSGATGRVSGPHLHLGVRWINQRINPDLLLAAPGELPDIGTSQ